jgi:hypothetical protein
VRQREQLRTVIDNGWMSKRGGNKHAALELGRQYEEGSGVPQDMQRAAQLYRFAASFTSGTTYIYSPPVRKGGSGRVMPLRVGMDQPGLPEAKYRLALLHLRGTGVKFDVKRAIKLLNEAATQGYAPASE